MYSNDEPQFQALNIGPPMCPPAYVAGSLSGDGYRGVHWSCDNVAPPRWKAARIRAGRGTKSTLRQGMKVYAVQGRQVKDMMLGRIPEVIVTITRDYPTFDTGNIHPNLEILSDPSLGVAWQQAN